MLPTKKSDWKAQAMIELLIVLPILFLLMVGMLQMTEYLETRQNSKMAVWSALRGQTIYYEYNTSNQARLSILCDNGKTVSASNLRDDIKNTFFGTEKKVAITEPTSLAAGSNNIFKDIGNDILLLLFNLLMSAQSLLVDTSTISHTTIKVSYPNYFYGLNMPLSNSVWGVFIYPDRAFVILDRAYIFKSYTQVPGKLPVINTYKKGIVAIEKGVIEIIKFVREVPGIMKDFVKVVGKFFSDLWSDTKNAIGQGASYVWEKCFGKSDSDSKKLADDEKLRIEFEWAEKQHKLTEIIAFTADDIAKKYLDSHANLTEKQKNEALAKFREDSKLDALGVAATDIKDITDTNKNDFSNIQKASRYQHIQYEFLKYIDKNQTITKISEAKENYKTAAGDYVYSVAYGSGAFLGDSKKQQKAKQASATQAMTDYNAKLLTLKGSENSMLSETFSLEISNTVKQKLDLIISQLGHEN